MTPGWNNLCGLIAATVPPRRFVSSVVSYALLTAVLGIILYGLLQ